MVKQVITFHYTLTNKEGKTIDSSRSGNPLIFLEGSGQIIPGLETAIATLIKGDKKNITVPYGQAYGPHDETQIFHVPRSKFPSKEIKVGDMFQIGKDHDYKVVTVVELSDNEVTVDANHPLAGKDLDFAVEIIDRREATPEEITHGHVHGAGGHDH